MAKTQIINALGAKPLLMPALLNAAVTANERAKYILTLLQIAAANADDPKSDAPTLRADRQACGIAETYLDRIVARSESLGPGVYAIPEIGHLIAMLSSALDTMLAPLVTAEDPAASEWTARKIRLFEALPSVRDNIIQAETITAMTSGRPVTGDGIHVLVMDLHKEINRLQAVVAEEDLDGARAYGLTDRDRSLLRAFMSGLSRTAILKFDHPGLATVATGSDGNLLIQNDIGETDAHVVVAQVVGFTVTVTYTDVHAQRLHFFQTALAETGIAWQETHSRQTVGLADGDLFYTVTGKLDSPDEEGVGRFLERLGSRIVFLIDWNRARKRLRLFVPNSLAVELLAWAAKSDLGHRAFLQLGGERLIYDALEQAVRTPLHYGEPLHEMLGVEAAADYLRFVLRTAAMGLRDGQSEMLIRDRIRAELFNHFRSAEQRLLADEAGHAAIIDELAENLYATLQGQTGSTPASHTIDIAKQLESRADEIVRKVRSTVQRIGSGAILRQIVEIADDAADELEDAAFLTSIQPSGDDHSAPAPLIELAALVVTGTKCFQRAIDAAPDVRRGGAQQPLQDFLEAVDGLVAAEHQTDAKERDVTAVLMSDSVDARQLYRFAGIAHHLEAATDFLLRAGLTLRDHILGEVMFE